MPLMRNSAGAAHSSQVRGATGGLQHEVAVAIGHERVDLGIALARAHHLSTSRRRSAASGALESAMVSLRHTRQRSSRITRS